MRFDLLLIDQPGKHSRRPVAGVTNQTFRLNVELVLDPIYHRLRRFYFCRSIGSGRLNIDDDAGLEVDQIVGRIGKEGGPTRCCRPRCRWIRQ